MGAKKFEKVFIETASRLYLASVSEPIYEASDWQLVTETYKFTSSEEAVRIAIKEVYLLLLETTTLMNENCIESPESEPDMQTGQRLGIFSKHLRK